MTLIEVLEIPLDVPELGTRTKCAHGRITGMCKACCAHGRRLDIVEHSPCPECPCLVGYEPHAWELIGPTVLGEASMLRCMGCGVVKG